MLVPAGVCAWASPDESIRHRNAPIPHAAEVPRRGYSQDASLNNLLTSVAGSGYLIRTRTAIHLVVETGIVVSCAFTRPVPKSAPVYVQDGVATASSILEM